MGLFSKKEPEMVEREDGLIDYNVYVMSKNEKLMYISLAAVCIFIVGMIFYHNAIIALLLSLLSLKFPKIRTKQIIEKRKKELNLQFKDMLYALSSSMVAGKSIEMAFKEVLKDLAVIYPDPDTPIIKEVQHIVRCLEMNQTVESALEQFAERAHIEDIEVFSNVFSISKRAGGNLVEVIRSTSNMIGDKIETKNDIETLITAKKFEARVLSLMPIAMVAMLTLLSPEFMSNVFTTIPGNIGMTVAIAMFVTAFFIAEKIMKIEV